MKNQDTLPQNAAFVVEVCGHDSQLLDLDKACGVCNAFVHQARRLFLYVDGQSALEVELEPGEKLLDWADASLLDMEYGMPPASSDEAWSADLGRRLCMSIKDVEAPSEWEQGLN